VVLGEHAATLERVAETGGAAFYSGELADRLAEHAAATGGALRGEDLVSHRPEWVEPLAAPAGARAVHELPPNGQGLAAVVALELLGRTDAAERDPDDPQSLHWQIEAVKQGLADAHAHVADPEAMTTRVADLLEPARLDGIAAGFDPWRAGDPGHRPPDDGGTVLVVAADAEGRVVSLLQSNYEGFGSGLVVPGTGIALHNRGAGFVTDPRHPNAVAPGKRPFHTIIPALATDHRCPPIPPSTRAAAAFGLMGGAMQAQGHVQLACRSAIGGESPQAAIDAPRWRVGAGRTVTVEPELRAATREALARRGHDVHTDADRAPFGGAQAVAALAGGGWAGASDPRKEGHPGGR
jgi:gamma-glutamyltranspeptidase/glutathione hydrolase